MKLHKLAKMFPEITGDDFKTLVLDIKKNGLRQPITTFEGEILDGANRYKACKAAGIEPNFVEFDGDDPVAFVTSQNLSRRHLTPSQKAAVGAEILKCGNSRITATETAKTLKIDRGILRDAVKLEAESPALHRKVIEGKMTQHAAKEKLHPSQKPLPRGGLCADAIRATRGDQEPEAAKPRPAHFPPLPPQPVNGKLVLVTLAQFKAELDTLAARIPATATPKAGPSCKTDMNPILTPEQKATVLGDRPNHTWFQTWSGRKFYPTDPRPEDVCIEDIAHHLSLTCRFNGACRQFYSVAQHSLLVEHIIPGLPSLLHDATEAYVGDMVRPLKLQMPEYQAVEAKVWLAICEHFEPMLPIELSPRVKWADNVALVTERRDLLKPSNHQWAVTEQPLNEHIRNYIPTLGWDGGEHAFLKRFNELVQGKI